MSFSPRYSSRLATFALFLLVSPYAACLCAADTGALFPSVASPLYDVAPSPAAGGVIQAGYQTNDTPRPGYYNQALQGPPVQGAPGPMFTAPLPVGASQPMNATSTNSQPQTSAQPSPSQSYGAPPTAPPPTKPWSPAASQPGVGPTTPPRFGVTPSYTAAGVVPATPSATQPLAPRTSTEPKAPSADASAESALPAAIEPAHDEPEESSAAEQSFSLEQSIRNDEERVARLKTILVNPQGEYRRAEAAFKESEARLRTIEPLVRKAQTDPSRASRDRSVGRSETAA
ncbi:MAG: hypothetical protein QM811_30405 [Pirellulales bacterium]